MNYCKGYLNQIFNPNKFYCQISQNKLINKNIITLIVYNLLLILRVFHYYNLLYKSLNTLKIYIKFRFFLCFISTYRNRKLCKFIYKNHKTVSILIRKVIYSTIKSSLFIQLVQTEIVLNKDLVVILIAAQKEKFKVQEDNPFIGQVKLSDLHSIQFIEQFLMFPLNKLDGFMINFVLFQIINTQDPKLNYF
ncbi:unnamed protein product [Paramecium primaurelia]|uniref:Transmembrane protein n=1 Tax=Paramecium primaurelia TaxID=5886 RepID=A0A8S1QTT1_PARPR|nr:unnamed protein product [Paramecium primaurelia]